MSNEKKCYLFLYNSKVGDYATIREVINSLPEIITWRHELDNSFFLISRHKASEISNSFRDVFGHETGKFLISEITSNKQGWLSTRSWHLINKKAFPPKE